MTLSALVIRDISPSEAVIGEIQRGRTLELSKPLCALSLAIFIPGYYLPMIINSHQLSGTLACLTHPNLPSAPGWSPTCGSGLPYSTQADILKAAGAGEPRGSPGKTNIKGGEGHTPLRLTGNS